MERIATALGVSQRTISEDLRNLEVTSKIGCRGRGRPKGSTGRPRRREQNAERDRGAQLFSKKKNPDGSRLELVNRGQRAEAAPLRQGRVPADQSNRSACQIIDRLKTTDDQVERVPASGR
jgi:hypothetical protein